MTFEEPKEFVDESNEPIKIFHKNNDTNLYELNTNELNKVLESIGNRPFSVISMNGVKKSGKSFLLNYIIRFLTEFCSDFGKEPSKNFLNDCDHVPKGFETGCGVDPTTIGILMWPKPFIVKDNNGQEVAILLLDTQGCFDNKADQKENALIFSVSAQLSDLLIFNVEKDILRDRDLQFMNLFLDYAKHLNKVGNNSSVTSDTGDQNINNCNNNISITDQSYYTKFNRLIILVRDFPRDPNYPYGYYDDGIKPEGAAKNYKFERINNSSLDLNETKISNCYEHVSCFLMPIPDHKIQNGNFTGKVCNMGNDFRKMLDHFINVIFTVPVFSTKKLQSQPITVVEFKNYVNTLAKYILENEAPDIMDLLQLQTLFFNTKRVNDMKNRYKEKMKEVYEPPMDENVLKNRHEEFRQNAIKEFQSDWKNGPPHVQREFQQILIEKLEKKWKKMREENEEKSRVKLKEWVEEIRSIHKRYMMPRDKPIGSSLLTEAHQKLKTYLLSKYPIPEVGSDNLRDEYKKQLDEAFLKEFDEVKKKDNDNCKNLLENKKEKIKELCETIITNECKGFPLTQFQFESKKTVFLNWANDKINELNQIFDITELDEIKSEIQNHICILIERFQRENTNKRESLLKEGRRFGRCLPFAGASFYVWDSLDEESKHKSLIKLAKGMAWLTVDFLTLGNSWEVRLALFLVLHGGHSLHTASKSNHLFSTTKEFCANCFHKCKRLFKKPPDNLIDADLTKDLNKDLLRVDDLKRDKKNTVKSDKDFAKPIDDLIGQQ